MSSSNGSIFSETLQNITDTKLEELSKRRSAFEITKSNILSMLENEKEPSRRLYILSQGVKACYALKLGKYIKIYNPAQSRNSELEFELKNLDCFLAQAKYDPSVSAKMMQTWEESLMRHLNTQSLTYQYASLYAQLVTEWLSTEKEDDGADVAMTEGFEDVASAMKQDCRREWERIVFEPGNIDESKLQTYLNQLFSIHEGDAPEKLRALNQFKLKVSAFETQMASPNQFDAKTLKWVADGLLTSGLLTDEQRGVLRDFKNNPIILGEIADVLNMRLTALDSWSWGSSVPLEQRRQISGVYNVLMHEDLLQAIFLQYIGVKWSVFLKEAFSEFRKTPGAWQTCWKRIPAVDAKRRAYYLGSEENRTYTVQFIRSRMYSKHYFMAQLMDHETQRTEAADGEEEADYAPVTMRQRQVAQVSSYEGLDSMEKPMAMRPQVGAKRHRRLPQPQRPYDQPDEDADEDGIPDPENTGSKQPMQSKQRLLRLLSTEIAINTKLYGEITAFHSTFERWNSLLPHETIMTVMSFFGVSETWLSFFKKFLKAPLKFLDDDPSIPSRNRSRGTPASHALTDVFGESILFCLDFAVNQSTRGAMLFRMQDDLWFWSRDHSVAVTAWQSITDFVNATGTYINPEKTGTTRFARDPSVSLEIDRSLPEGDIRWGFLRLSPKTGKFEIDQKMVDKHIIDLRKQLHDKRKSIISFIQAWNTYAATFFTSNFGEPANCFGQDHVAQMLATHERIQREVFSSSSSLTSGNEGQQSATNIVDYLKNLMRERFGITDIPDAYLFFPIELGGLDLKSPFISILQVHDTVLEDPSKKLDEFFNEEKDAYNSLKHDFEKSSNSRHQDNPDLNWEPEDKADRDRFMSFAEFTRYREDISYSFAGNLRDVYKELMRIPEENGIQNANPTVLNGLIPLARQGNLRCIKGNWYQMEPYWKWVAQLYGPEVMDRFGGMNIVEPGLLPMGMVSIFRDKRVQWQG